MTDAMTTALAAAGPNESRAAAMDLYGRLVGTWDVHNRYLDAPGGTWETGTVVWTFGWILAGQAVQDVMWFTHDGDGARATGSTVRLYDPAAGAWHVVWFSPNGTTSALTGRPARADEDEQHGEHIREGDIVQEGTGPDGRPIRWLFTEVTEDSFRWLGYTLDDDGATWRFEQEMLAKRRG